MAVSIRFARCGDAPERRDRVGQPGWRAASVPGKQLVFGLRVSEEEESIGLDLALHNERGYNL